MAGRDRLSVNRRVAAYLDEMASRYNNRNNPYLFRDTLLKLIGAENLRYDELTGTAR